jgi:hypothetical protein
MEHVEVVVVNWSRACRTATHALPNRRAALVSAAWFILEGSSDQHERTAGCCPRDFFFLQEVSVADSQPAVARSGWTGMLIPVNLSSSRSRYGSRRETATGALPGDYLPAVMG